MKNIFTSILRWVLKKLAQLMILRYRPGIIGVTGSVGKTSAKLAIAAVLGPSRRTRFSKGNLNNELGLPLTIIGDFSDDDLKLVSRDTPAGEKKVGKVTFWLEVIFTGLMNLARRKRDYPEILVLEYGADKPGNIKELIDIARPNISVITAIGDIPAHVEFFAGPQEVTREKSKLIEQLPSAGFAVLNRDDEIVMSLKERTRAHIITFGFQKGAEMRVVNFGNVIENGKPAGVSFKMEYGGSSVPVKIYGAFGKVQAYAASAAATVGLIFGINLIKISEALKSYKPAPARMELLLGVKDSLVIDGSYNASPLSMESALDTLRDLSGSGSAHSKNSGQAKFTIKRKIAILGDMLELGEYSIQAHERIGKIAAQAADVLITVGTEAKVIAEAARKNGLAKKNIKSFDTAEDAIDPLPETLKKGDLILVKGSHAMELEKVVEAIKVIAGN